MSFNFNGLLYTFTVNPFLPTHLYTDFSSLPPKEVNFLPITWHQLSVQAEDQNNDRDPMYLDFTVVFDKSLSGALEDMMGNENWIRIQEVES